MSGRFLYGWTYIDLAVAIGMRALGEDIAAIASTIGDTPDNVRKMLHVSRHMLATDGWPAVLLRNQEAIERQVNRHPPNDPEPVEPFKPRKFRPVLTTMPARNPDITAEVLGDPTPEQRARIEERAAQEAERKRPSRHY